MNQKFYLEVQKGGTLTNNAPREKLLWALRGLSPGRWCISIEKYKKKRSLSQNGYYHKIVVPCVLDGLIDMGFEPENLSKEVVHEFLKAKFLKKDIGNEDGEFITIVRSTASLTTVEFAEYLENVSRWAAETLNVVIPEPNSQTEIF